MYHRILLKLHLALLQAPYVSRISKNDCATLLQRLPSDVSSLHKDVQRRITAVRRYLDLFIKDFTYPAALRSAAASLTPVGKVPRRATLELRSARNILRERALGNAAQLKVINKLSRDEARARLKAEADFLELKPELQEVIEGASTDSLLFKAGFLPKFHCELNPIERVWCQAKHDLRERVMTKGKDRFPYLVERALESICPERIGRFFRLAEAYIKVYAEGDITEYAAAKSYVRAMASHRRPPGQQLDEVVERAAADIDT